MNLREQFQSLEVELKQKFHDASFELEELPSGVFFFRVWQRSKLFVIEYVVREGKFGVEEVPHDATPFDAGYENIFNTFLEAAIHLKSLLLNPNL